MKGPRCRRPTEDLATRAVLVVGVILDDLTAGDGLTQLLHADAPQDTLIDRMLRKLELVRSNLVSYLFDQIHNPVAERL